MNRILPALAAVLMSLPAIPLTAANEFLDVPDENLTAGFWQGYHWKPDDPAPTEQGAPIRCEVSCRRLADMPWGQIVRYRFQSDDRAIEPLYFLVRPEVILELDSPDMARTLVKVSHMAKPPKYDPGDVRCGEPGGFPVTEGSWTTEMTDDGDLRTYLSHHPSGHFRKMIWKRGAGLVYYASGYGAMQDGFRVFAPGSDPEACVDGPPSFMDAEQIGQLQPGLAAAKVTDLLGQPAKKGDDQLWGADGMHHQDWSWPARGITLDMASEAEGGDKTVASITITAPCDLKTRRWVGIGDDEPKIRAAYQDAPIENHPGEDGHTLVVGDVYWGLFFTLSAEGKVSRIFMGAGAE
jgi:hypothetical protein